MDLLLSQVILLWAACGGCYCYNFGKAKTSTDPVVIDRRKREEDTCHYNRCTIVMPLRRYAKSRPYLHIYRT